MSTPELAITTQIDLMKNLWLTRAVWAAAELGVADHLIDSPKSAGQLAAALHVHEPALKRLLRALVSEGFFSESNGTYANSPKSEGLRSDLPWSMRASARAQLGQEHYAAWGDLLHSVQTGSDAVSHHFHMPVWDYYTQNPRNAAVFHDSMTSLTSGVEQAVLDAYDFTSFSHIIDIGGGHGRLLSKILATAPNSRGTLFDQPRVLDGAPALDPRIQKTTGDFFHSVPQAGDLYTLKFILHDWNDDQSIAILKNIRAAMAPAARILLIETVIPEGNDPSFAKFLDLNMLVMTGGQERTAAQYAALFRAAGLHLTRVIPTHSPCSIIEAAAA
ncbi:MAG TPA: methyltransferase [Phycisphaerae bacterium]|jgi:hypothetical protein|nr:methyltransferase [Phycisphaerae bacterium]